MDSLTYVQIKSLTLNQAKELYHKLDLDIPKHADLDYLRSNLRLIKKRLDEKKEHTYVNLNQVDSKVSNNNVGFEGKQIYINLSNSDSQEIKDRVGPTHFLDHVYEEIDLSLSAGSSFDDFDSESDSEAQLLKMTSERIPTYNIGTFSGEGTEDVEAFLRKFEKLAEINSWTDSKKKLYVSLYLSGLASDRLEIIERQDLNTRLK